MQLIGKELMRKAVVAGQFYPDSKKELTKTLKSFLKIEEDASIKAAVVPHAGYFFSGKCAGKVYSLLPCFGTYVILGVNHNAVGKDIAISLEDFETPLGIVKNDVDLGRAILHIFGLDEDNEAHRYEHSIEVQLPFLQATHQNFEIVPIILKNYNLEVCKSLAKAIVSSAKKLRKKVVLIASSDFTHSGPDYGFLGSMEIDKEAIYKIAEFNSEEFMKTADKTTICGSGAIATVIEAAKLLGSKEAELLEYYDSSKIAPNVNKVGYAGIVFR